ncbi:polymer-forming cytoskeletal protein [Deinococcus deserti]|uniref:polymer-forming cytoskeletal protein n=1 Tax=Deinococcus deserti TaxID=310783 RepID=UPI0002DB761A|nr:polymer-forming cytoskeletal protein [Deinococcus deserti]
MEWLHLEADGALAPETEAALAALPDQAEVQRQRERLARAAQVLRTLDTPALPHSVALPAAQEVAWSARLQMLPVPEQPVSVAAQVQADIRIARQLREASVPVLPASLAAEVAQTIRFAQQLSPPALPQPTLPHSVAASVVAEVTGARQLSLAPPPLPRSVAASVMARMRSSEIPYAAPVPPEQIPRQVPVHILPSLRRHNPAPLILVLALLLGLTLLAVTTAWPNLAAGMLVLRTLLAQVSPVAGVGLGLLLLTSLLVTWRPTPALRQVGAGAFALSAVLTLPALYQVVGQGDIRFGQDITVQGPVKGNVIVVGGDVHLHEDARVQGEVVTLLGDVQRSPGAQVSGRVNALLGHAPGDLEALETQPPAGISLATAAAFRPVLGWLGAAAWPQVFVTLTGGALLLLFVAGAAPGLAQRQRHAPMRTLALGVLVLAALIGPALALALAGLLGPSLLGAALAVLIIALGLSVSAYDVGRALATRARLPVPDAVGALLGLSAVAASLSLPPLAFGLALIGGAWGAGTLVLAREHLQRP